MYGYKEISFRYINNILSIKNLLFIFLHFLAGQFTRLNGKKSPTAIINHMELCFMFYSVINTIFPSYTIQYILYIRKL